MRKINKLASLLDKAGNFILADKLDKIAQVQNNDVLETNDPSTFVSSLFNFARNRNINNLSQAFISYSRSGAKYKGTAISTNPETIKLYQYVVQNPRMLYPQQLIGVLQANLNNPTGKASDQKINSNVFQNTGEDLETRANSDDLNNQAVPTNYNYYYNYLADRKLNRIAPVGTNNDNQRREQGYSNKQDLYFNEYITNINNGQDINAAVDEIKNDSNLTDVTRQTLLKRLGYK